jgi:crotonobetainyl-CoA:carnitine CoA-transferase CaiB-like acyl-CoA transferase
MNWKFSKTPLSIRLPANCLGEHNEYVLGSLLGMTEDEIAQLEAERIIGKEYLPGSDQ